MPIIVVTGKEIEKIKGDFESYLNGLNMVGEISYSQYSELYDEGTKQIQRAYELGRAELEKENAELKAQIEKLIDFVLSKTECCDVCPITDTCINSEGTCPYAGILAKGEEEVTREWLMQFISKEIKENDKRTD